MIVYLLRARNTVKDLSGQLLLAFEIRPISIVKFFWHVKNFPMKQCERHVTNVVYNVVRKTHGPNNFCVDCILKSEYQNDWWLSVDTLWPHVASQWWGHRLGYPGLDHGESRPEALDLTTGIKIFSRTRCLLSGRYWVQSRLINTW